MRKYIFVAFLLLIPNPLFAQNVGPLDSFAWDYVNSDRTTYNVVEFEVCIDGSCVRHQETAVRWVNASPPPPVGQTSYKIPIGPQTVGQHTLTVAACNTSGCGNTISIPFVFILSPPAVLNGRFVSGGD
jgi:hypothetical protein